MGIYGVAVNITPTSMESVTGVLVVTPWLVAVKLFPIKPTQTAAPPVVDVKPEAMDFEESGNERTEVDKIRHRKEALSVRK